MEHKEWISPLLIKKKKKNQEKINNIHKLFAFNKQAIYQMIRLKKITSRNTENWSH